MQDIAYMKHLWVHAASPHQPIGWPRTIFLHIHLFFSHPSLQYLTHPHPFTPPTLFHPCHTHTHLQAKRKVRQLHVPIPCLQDSKVSSVRFKVISDCWFAGLGRVPEKNGSPHDPPTTPEHEKRTKGMSIVSPRRQFLSVCVLASVQVPGTGSCLKG